MPNRCSCWMRAFSSFVSISVSPTSRSSPLLRRNDDQCRCQGYFMGGEGGWDNVLLSLSCTQLVLRSRPCVEGVGGRWRAFVKMPITPCRSHFGSGCVKPTISCNCRRARVRLARSRRCVVPRSFVVLCSSKASRARLQIEQRMTVLILS